MRSSKSWPWILGAATAGVAVGLVLGRTGSAVPGPSGVVAGATNAHQAPTTRYPGPSILPKSDLPPPVATGQKPAPTGSPAASSPAGRESAAITSETPPASSEWEDIPIDRAFGETLGSWETRKAFAKNMRGLDTFIPCVRQWKAPPQLDKVEIDTELRLRSDEGALVVEDVVILGGNVSDSALEGCVIARSRGQRVEVPGMEPGRRYRIKWGGLATLR